jgi:hypothetical protein
MTSSLKEHAGRCRWVTPTIFLDAPYWVEAEASPWACIRDAEPRPLATTEECLACHRSERLQRVSHAPAARRRSGGARESDVWR